MASEADKVQLEKTNNQIVSEFSKTLEMFSLNKTEAQLFVTLYLHEAPMTLDQMKDALGKSKTAMSYAIRRLQEFNLVERVWQKGVRKDLYEARQDLYKKFMKTYVNRWLESLNLQINNLAGIQEDLDHYPSDQKQLITHKIHEAISFHKSLEEVFSNIKKNDFL
ncbi:Betaine operon transcriptional regulator [Gracilibacillus boraciitolerans JCM 21714]|uniref:HTH-type transcriptional regulator n=1 Tax=Gracilibacillus boraciitolerans JCM 21714 TaxID=1298598 RepID=W4VKF6_9BACI|nr:transcriptional regulator [Gracilibacillus boraciitolerans]GAE93303.1 Betaine operon transcriptional regulator [Gracilibacillus boraciitolerans JCM 21714]